MFALEMNREDETFDMMNLSKHRSRALDFAAILQVVCTKDDTGVSLSIAGNKAGGVELGLALNLMNQQNT